MKRIMSVFLFLFVLLASLTFDADAIPAFARKYDMSCQTCHSPIPKLKPFGDDFATNGYQLAGQEPPRYYKDVGDDKLLLMRDLPLAVRLEGFASFQQNSESQTDFQSPFIMKLLSGGQIAKDISYYFYFLMNEGGTIVGPEDAFLYFNNLMGADFDLIVGQFQVSDPLFKRELRLTREDYVIYDTQVGNSSATLTYDRGIMMSYSLPTKTDIILEILNGNGLSSTGAAGFMDNDKNKNFMIRASQDVSNMLRVGIFGYLGNEEQSGESNSTNMYGPDLTFSLSKFELNAQYVHREDNNPSFISGTVKQKTDGAFAEVVYSPDDDKSDWYGIVLYNWVKSDFAGLSYQSITVSGNYMLARNLRLTAEFTHDLEDKINRVSIGFVSAF